jgi:hypothetical protein
MVHSISSCSSWNYVILEPDMLFRCNNKEVNLFIEKDQTWANVSDENPRIWNSLQDGFTITEEEALSRTSQAFRSFLNQRNDRP